MNIADVIANNQVLVGLVGATLTGGLLFAARQVPEKIALALREAFTVTLVLDDDDATYHHMSVWLARHEASRRARRLMIAEAFDYEKGRWVPEITLGAGWHVVMVGGWPVIVHRHIQDADALGKALGGARQQRLTLIVPGRRQQPLRDLVDLAERAYRGLDMVEVLFWVGGNYEVADRRAARSLDTIFMPESQKRRLVNDLIAFSGAREQYRRRGVPWRRGYFLEGPPGTGKTSLIQALAGVIGRSVYVVNLNSLTSDNELVRAVNQVGWDGVLVIEDIDAIKASRDREAAPAPVPMAMGMEQARGVTLSGLLNAIDGLTAREGRILFMTSNHPDTLDPALIRPGRIDLREHVGPLGETEALCMFRAFRPGAAVDEFEREIKPHLPMTAAALQGRLLAVQLDEAA